MTFQSSPPVRSALAAGAYRDPRAVVSPPGLPPTAGIGRWVDEGGAGGDVESGSMRVLVVEDDALIGELLSEMLVGLGYDVCAVAATESQAVAEAALTRPDLLIVDANLGDGSGIDAVKTISAAGPVAHVFTSGDAGKVRHLMPGSVVVQKPFDEAGLTDAIARALALD